MKALKTLNKEWLRQAESLGLLNDKLFREAIDAYTFQIELIEALRQNIKATGTTITIPVGRDNEKVASNPAIADLNKAEILAQKIRLELDKKMERAIESSEKRKKHDRRL